MMLRILEMEPFHTIKQVSQMHMYVLRLGTAYEGAGFLDISEEA
jgi:hypothetical protein